ncbi:OLC1v1026268C1 [Oldenlandia corymbosa var. corymbosa]|uniref:OLC1v1026268C1 n=1 Tax=Oldenlandia corymbosa var. corymbosa TaxID=529605 RepID=A0AAV1C6N2_OLDCO|nr:OLC1v1026268C1 [Oldenlandia corymbosa var. corymbosa]
MESLQKLSEAISLGKEKREGMQSAVGLVVLEWQDAEGQLEQLRGIIRGCLGELESKEKHLRGVEESVRKSFCEDFDSRRKKLIEAGFRRLDGKALSLKGVLRKIEIEKMGFGEMEETIAKKMKDLLLIEEKIRGALGVKQSQAEVLQMELDLMEENLRRREDENASKEKNFIIRENKVYAAERTLQRRQIDVVTGEEKLKRRSNELDSRERILVAREKEVLSQQKLLEERTNQVDSKEKDSEMRENVLHSEAEILRMRENGIKLREEKLVNLTKQLEAKTVMLESLKFELFSLKNSLEQSTPEADPVSPTNKSAVVRRVGGKRDSPDDQEKNSDENHSKHAKRSSSILDEQMRQNKAPDLQNSGTHCKSQAQITGEDVILHDVLVFDSGSISKLASSTAVYPTSFTSAEKGKLAVARSFSTGEIWACFDVYDYMPRSYAQIINVFVKGGEIRLEVEWLKPCPTNNYETDWIRAGLPVACGEFECGGRSVEFSEIFSHPIVCSGSHPHSIIPGNGETWAIYKDWNITTWASDSKLHKQCSYEIVEIQSYPQDGSSSSGIRVVYLDRIPGSSSSRIIGAFRFEYSVKSLYLTIPVPLSSPSSLYPTCAFLVDRSSIVSGKGSIFLQIAFCWKPGTGLSWDSSFIRLRAENVRLFEVKPRSLTCENQRSLKLKNRDMGSLEKLSKVLGLFEETKERIKQRMKVVAFECDEVEDHYKGVHQFSRECVDEIDSREKNLRSREDDIAAKEKNLNLRVEKVDEMERNLERKQQDIDSEEKRRKDEIDAEEKNLDLRVNKVDEMERNVERRRHEIDSEEKRNLSELDSRMKNLVEKEKELGAEKKKLISEQKLLEERSFQVDWKEKHLENREMELNSEAGNMNKRENELDERDEKLMNFAKKLEVKEGILDIKSELLSVKNFVVQFFRQLNNAVSPTKPADLTTVGRKKISPGDEQRNLEKERSSIHEKSTSQIKANDPGIYNKSGIPVPEDVIDIDPEPDIELVGNLASKSAGDPSFSRVEKGKQTRNFNVGETWTCLDAEDHMPRTYARITDVINRGGEIMLRVAWLKPCPRETWVIYKDWEIMEWVSNTQIYRHYDYEIVEILPSPPKESSFSGVTVAYLDRITESGKFKRRSKNNEDSFIIKPNCLYRFSHKAPSMKIICIGEDDILDTVFELDQNCLPLRLH